MNVKVAGKMMLGYKCISDRFILCWCGLFNAFFCCVYFIFYFAFLFCIFDTDLKEIGIMCALMKNTTAFKLSRTEKRISRRYDIFKSSCKDIFLSSFSIEFIS